MFKLSKEQEVKAQELHKKAIVIDTMNYAPKHLPYSEYIETAKKGGLTAHLFGANKVWASESFSKFTEVSVRHIYSYIYGRSETILIDTAEDVKRAKREGKVALGLGTADLSSMVSDLFSLRMLYNLGLRTGALTYQGQNPIGAGGGESFDAGLSDFGEKVVEEMNKLGILIDLSHSGVKTSLETINLSKDPVIFSHSGIHSLLSVPRNVNDEQLQALAEKDGVIGLPSFSCIVKMPVDTQPTMEDWVKQADYVVDLIGIDHVGIGTDIDEGIPRDEIKGEIDDFPSIWKSFTIEKFDKGWLQTKDLGTAAELPNITRALVYSGYSDANVLKILGGNFLKVFEKVWKK